MPDSGIGFFASVATRLCQSWAPCYLGVLRE